MIKKVILKGKTLASNIFYFLGLSFIDSNKTNIYTISSNLVDDNVNSATGTLSNGISFTINSSSTYIGNINNVLSLNNSMLNKWSVNTSWCSNNEPDSQVEIIFNSPMDLKYICMMIWNQAGEYNLRDYLIYECYDEQNELIGGSFLGNLDITKIKPFDVVSGTIDKLYLKILPLGKLIKNNISYNFNTKTKQIQEGDFNLIPLFLPDLTGYEKLIIKDNIKIQKPIEVTFPYELITIKDIPLNNNIYNWTLPYFTPHSANFRFLIKLNDGDKWYYFKSVTLLEEFTGNDYSIIPAYTFTGTTWSYIENALNIPKQELKKVSIKFIILNNSQIFESVNFNNNSFLYRQEAYNVTTDVSKLNNRLEIKTSVATLSNIKWYEEKISKYPYLNSKNYSIDISTLVLSDKYIYDGNSIKINTKILDSELNQSTSEYEISLENISNMEVIDG